MVQFASRLIFQGDSEYQGPIIQFCLYHLLYPKRWLGHEEGVKKVLRLSWFNFCLDPFFKGNPNLKREIWNLYCGSIYGYIRDGYWERVRQPCPIWMVQLSPRPIFWGELEFQDRIIVAGLQPAIQPKQSRGPRGWSGDLIQMDWFIHHQVQFLE